MLQNPSDPRRIEPNCQLRGLVKGKKVCTTCQTTGVEIKVFYCSVYVDGCTIRGPQPDKGQICSMCNHRRELCVVPQGS